MQSATRRRRRTKRIPPYFWAHRGLSEQAPEDSLSSWTAAGKKGYGMEGDFRPSSNGTLWCCHDATVDRTTNGTGTVSALADATLVALDNGSKFNATGFVNERLPTVSQMLAAARSISGWAIPENSTGTLADGRTLVAAIRAAGLDKRCVIQMFDAPLGTITQLQLENPDLQFILLLGNTTPSVAQIQATKVGWVGPDSTQAYFNKAYVDSLHAVGIKVVPYTIDTLATYATVKSYGVDGVFTGRPDLLTNGLAAPGTFRENWDGTSRGGAKWLLGDDWIRDSYNYYDSLAPRPFNGNIDTTSINNIAGVLCVGRPLPLAGTFTLDTTITLTTSNADATRWIGIQIVQQDLLVKAFAPVPVGSNAYGFILRQNGTIEIGKYVSGLASTTLATLAGVAMSVGVGVPITITITDASITLKRNDTGASVTANDVAFRGGKLGILWSNSAMKVGPIIGG